MLVITRETGQYIFIGENAEIKLKILSNDGNFIRIGVDAPKSMPINREERHYWTQNQKNRTVKTSKKGITGRCSK